MYTCLVHQLAAMGHDVRVVAPTFESATRVGNEGGITILRVKSGTIFKTGVIEKGLNTLLLNVRYANAMKATWHDWSPEWLISVTPPITLGPFLKTLKKKHKARLYLILRDIFPQNAKDLGMIRDPITFSYFRIRERNLYKICDIIGCMSPGNILYLKKQDPDIFSRKKVMYFPNWIQPTPAEFYLKEDRSFHKQYGLEDKFVVLFGGNFGKPQRIEFILALADRVKFLEDVCFCFVGDGTEKNKLKSLAEKMKLHNVLIFDRLPRDDYQALIHDADIGLVNLSEKFTIPNIPSRTFGYWDASLPVLAATDVNTDLNDAFLKKYNGGLWVQTGKIDDYMKQFMQLYSDQEKRKILGQNGRQAVIRNFSVQKAAERLLDQIALVPS